MSLSYSDAAVAAELLVEALKLDPDYPAAHAYLAFCHQLRFVHDGRFDEADKMSGIRHARAAIASGVDDATALAVAAITVAHLEKNFDVSLDAIERALSAQCILRFRPFLWEKFLHGKARPPLRSPTRNARYALVHSTL